MRERLNAARAEACLNQQGPEIADVVVHLVVVHFRAGAESQAECRVLQESLAPATTARSTDRLRPAPAYAATPAGCGSVPRDAPKPKRRAPHPAIRWEWQPGPRATGPPWLRSSDAVSNPRPGTRRSGGRAPLRPTQCERSWRDSRNQCRLRAFRQIARSAAVDRPKARSQGGQPASAGAAARRTPPAPPAYSFVAAWITRVNPKFMNPAMMKKRPQMARWVVEAAVCGSARPKWR